QVLRGLPSPFAQECLADQPRKKMSAEKEWHSPQFRMNFLLQSHRSTRFQSGKDKIPPKLLNLCTVSRSAYTTGSFPSMHFGKVAVATAVQLSLVVYCLLPEVSFSAKRWTSSSHC